MRAAFGLLFGMAAALAACGGGGTRTGDTALARREPATGGEPGAARSTGNPSSGVAGVDSLRSRSPVPGSRRTVVFLGTSLTAGLGLDPEDAYPSLLQRKADSLGFHFEFVNAGLSGETSAGALRRVDWILRQPADVIVIESGANDGLRGLDVDSTRANLQAIIAKVKAARPSARILLAQMEAPPNLGAKYTAAFRAMFEEVARAEGVTLMPFLLEGVAGVTSLNQQDGIHPNERGEEIVAANVWRALVPVLTNLDSTARGS